jgi:hypothetical protein
MSARSPILGWLTLSAFNEAARFRVHRVIEELELGVGSSEPFSGYTGFDEPRRLDSVEMLTGDRGVSKLDGSPLAVSDMMLRGYTWVGSWNQLSVRAWEGKNI